ncbi:MULTISPECIES: peroxiredoxin-like family protein [Paenibacillus]|uniref:peroxiredoxin-like family protein n=1 Tax=Paenibacillus TaxID=44249 RepID=UPI001F223F66|nr:peroxiredoxin-like family protein [Paenibacillus sp. JJ-223]CAH1197293.1 Thiol-disulfide oxidoreductase ResA [Paenibacillus sp. JJ-223]
MSTMTLTSALEKITAASPFEVQAIHQRVIQQLQEGGNATGLPVGTKAKDFELSDSLGNQINLADELAKGPVVLTFYRGGWCPYCNRQLRAYQEILPDIQALGAQLIAVSPQLPDYTLSDQEKAEMSFKVLSDPKGIVAAKYNLLYDVPDYLRDMYLSHNIDLHEYNGTDHWVLPMTGTFMIDEYAVIRSAYVNPDFTKRMEPEDILWELQKL